jgi:hypothetical protein
MVSFISWKIRSISISYSITKTREEKDPTLKLEKDILNLEDIMNSAPSELIQSSLNSFISWNYFCIFHK